MADDTPGPDAAKSPPPKDDGKKEEKKKPLWPWVVGGAAIAVFALVILWIIFGPHAKVRTEDAYVTAHYATIAPRVQGQVAIVPVNDNQRVRAGDLLMELDDRDYRATLEKAQATLVTDQAQAAEAAAQVERQPSLIREAQAQVASAQARRAFSATDTQRYANLAATGAGTVQQRQQSATSLRQDDAAVEQARAQVTAAVKQLAALRAALEAANGRVAQDEAQVAQDKLNLSYTRIFAPIDGTIDQRQVQVGDIVQAGSPVMTLVPLQDVYVMANYREPSLQHMRPGQRARVHVDAYDIYLDAVVDSIPPATGAAFSPIPPNNATGNFTKIVQRLPVKIVFVAGQPLAKLVRVGMSTEVVVDTGLDDVVAQQGRHDTAITARPVRP